MLLYEKASWNDFSMYTDEIKIYFLIFLFILAPINIIIGKNTWNGIANFGNISFAHMNRDIILSVKIIEIEVMDNVIGVTKNLYSLKRNIFDTPLLIANKQTHIFANPANKNPVDGIISNLWMISLIFNIEETEWEGK